MDKETGVLIAVLTSGDVRAELADSLVRMVTDGRYRLGLTWSWAIPTSANRQQIVRMFLESDHDYLLMIDSDMWPYTNLLDVVEADKDVVVFPSPMWRPGTEQPPIISSIATLDGGPVNLDDGDLVEVESGASVFLIARRVLEQLEPPAFEFLFDDFGLMTVTEDISFCDKVRDAGFTIWGAYSHPCGHVKTIDLVDLHNAVKEWRA